MVMLKAFFRQGDLERHNFLDGEISDWHKSKFCGLENLKLPFSQLKKKLTLGYYFHLQLNTQGRVQMHSHGKRGG